MEEYTPETQEVKADQIKRWFQDNLRIIISVAIVVLIAGGIYSYSKRGESPIVTTDQAIEDSEETASSTNVSDISKSSDEEKATTENKQTTAVSTAPVSQETGSSFVETAGKGDGTTVLARRAAANYLEKNPDSALTKEHKIYIEDYLRKNVGHKGGVHVGTTVEFSKDLVQKAIEQSKTLNEGQLKNLQKYSARVSSLS